MAWAEKEKIRQGVRTMLEVNLAVSAGERILIMTDPPTLGQWHELDLNKLQEALERSALAKLVADLAQELLPRSQVAFLAYPGVGRHGAEPDSETATSMQTSDVIVAITSYSLTHTRAAKEACRTGTRMASMPDFLAEMFEGPMRADYHRVAQDSKMMAQLLTSAKTAILTTKAGTELVLDLAGRSGDVDDGFIPSVRRPINLPGGEAYIAPVEGRAQGKVVVTPKGYQNLEQQMTILFERGVVSDIEGGGRVGDELRALLELPAPGLQTARRTLAELGIGTNPMAQSAKSTLEGEKIKGTVHIAIGDNSGLGGVVMADSHQDFVLWDPDLSLDGRLVIREGKWQV